MHVSPSLDRATTALSEPTPAASGAERLLQRQVKKFKVLALTDDVTRTPNRLAFRPMYHMRLRQFSARGRRFALALGDLNEFGRFNKSWGWVAGNGALQAYALGVSRLLRTDCDGVFRMHGDEFAFVLDVDNQAALDRVLERLAGPFPLRIRGRRASVSATVVGLLVRKRDTEKLFASVDRRLRRAKSDLQRRPPPAPRDPERQDEPAATRQEECEPGEQA